jgi:hypothetical protein
MPLYDIEHVVPLTDEQQSQLAQAFTKIHAHRFQTPSFFINVRFTDASQQRVYRGGVLKWYNRAILRTRAAENRSREMYGDHCKDLIRAWSEIVGGEGNKELRTVWVMGALTTAVEMGIRRPAAGEEIAWLKEHKTEFQRLADEGDEEMKGLMDELAAREEFSGVL